MQYSWVRRGSTSSQYEGWMPRLIAVPLRFQRRPSAAKKGCRPPHSGRPDGRYPPKGLGRVKHYPTSADGWEGRRKVPKLPLSYHMTQALTGHGCFQNKMGRPLSARCHHYDCISDSPGHTLVDCVYKSDHRDELTIRLGHRPPPGDLQDILCGPTFEALPVDWEEKASALRKTEETFRLFYRITENSLTY